MVDAAERARIELRTNVFVLAAISADRVSGAVRIRNLSPSGALIEGAALPLPGEPLVLRRGENSIGGKVVWCHDGKAGLRFDGQATVGDWLPAAQSSQQRVDEAFQGLKSGAAEPPAASAAPPARPFSPSDLRQLARAIDALADALADDDAVVARHAAKLQTLDIAAQTLRKLAGLS